MDWLYSFWIIGKVFGVPLIWACRAYYHVTIFSTIAELVGSFWLVWGFITVYNVCLATMIPCVLHFVSTWSVILSSYSVFLLHIKVSIFAWVGKMLAEEHSARGMPCWFAKRQVKPTFLWITCHRIRKASLRYSVAASLSKASWHFAFSAALS